MGKSWDKSGISYNTEVWKECLRVLKHGGHLLAFGGSRTYHRLAVAIEDAGFEIRDQIMWIYGEGFPKNLNISKQIDKQAGVTREIIGEGKWNSRKVNGSLGVDSVGLTTQKDYQETAPATSLAKYWNGWGTALKPAHEPIVLARKPLSEKTVSENVIAWGTGGINIDECRVPTSDKLGGGMVSKGRPKVTEGWDRPWMHDEAVTEQKKLESAENVAKAEELGRHPANVCHDGSDEVEAEFAKYGEKSYGSNGAYNYSDKEYEVEGFINNIKPNSPSNYGDKGTASRFFYCAKIKKTDRNEGCEELDPKEWKEEGAAVPMRAERPFNKSFNNHPTVKPTELMRYLCKLVTPKGGTILDPFCGSGSTGKAAVLEGFNFTGIELDAEYIKIAEARIKFAEKQCQK